MKTFLSKHLATFGRRVAVVLAVSLMALACTGCDMDSPDSTAAVPSNNDGKQYNFSGLYARPTLDEEGNPIALVFPIATGNRPSGKLITSLRLLQYGTVLEAYDSAGMTWRGSISALDGNTATFSIRGRTTAGMSTEIAGTMVYQDTTSKMNATWIEPNYYGSLFAQATVSPITTNTPAGRVAISPSTATLTTNSPTQIFTATGGTTFNWSQSNPAAGSLNKTQGTTVTYTRNGVGKDTLTVKSELGSASATITCP